MERYSLEHYDAMPYTSRNALPVRDFFKNSHSRVAWTTKSFLDAWSSAHTLYGRRLAVHRGFRRICEGGHVACSQHYAGLALDFAAHLSPPNRAALHAELARSSPFRYLEPLSHTNDHIHADVKPSREHGYPPLALGAVGVYVLLLQDALSTLGILGSELDGFYGPLTERCVRLFQHAVSLPVTGTADAATWRALTFAACAAGATPTVSYMNR